MTKGKNIRGWIIESLPPRNKIWKVVHDNSFYIHKRDAKDQVRTIKLMDFRDNIKNWEYRVLPIYTIDFIEDETQE